jgi:hypothetical protein
MSTNSMAPAPWRLSAFDNSILDAEGHLVCIVAGRLALEPDVIKTLLAAPELLEAYHSARDLLERVGKLLETIQE